MLEKIAKTTLKWWGIPTPLTITNEPIICSMVSLVSFNYWGEFCFLIIIVWFRWDLYPGSEVFVRAGARDVGKVLNLQVPIQVGQFFDALVVEFLAFGHHKAGVWEVVGIAEGPMFNVPAVRVFGKEGNSQVRRREGERQKPSSFIFQDSADFTQAGRNLDRALIRDGLSWLLVDQKGI